jgi:cytochrome c-type protein NapB
MFSRRFGALALVPAVFLFAGGASYGGGSAESVDADELSYRSQPLLEDGSVPAASYGSDEPGDSQRLNRSFENSPPLIPHSTEGLLPITMDENSCLDCHLPDAAEDTGATAVPASHLYDIRHDQQLTELAGDNYSCTMCHVPQADAPTLVDNDFEPMFRDAASTTSSNLLDTLNEGVE